MSSDSDNEEYFDASETTPSKCGSDIRTCYSNEEDRATHTGLLPTLQEESYANEIAEKVAPKCVESYDKKSRISYAASPFSSSLCPPLLTNKLTSSLPTLHLQETQPSHSHSIFGILDKTSMLKNDSSSALMPPPKILPVKYDAENATIKKINIEETGSACSESLLETLSSVSEVDLTNLRRRGRRDRQSKSRTTQQDEEEDSTPIPPSSTSPGESPASSIDTFPSNQKSAPFRVVEVDATSIYSTTFSVDKGSKMSLKQDQDKNIEMNAASPEKSSLYEEVLVSRKITVPVPTENSPFTFSPEPDIVASTKSNSLPRDEISPPTIHPIVPPTLEVGEGSTTVSTASHSSVSMAPPTSAPIPPPRKRRQRKRDDDSMSVSSMASLPTPTLSVCSKDADAVSHHLDLQEASRGRYIVSSQDTIQSRAPDYFKSVASPKTLSEPLPFVEEPKEQTESSKTPSSATIQNRKSSARNFSSVSHDHSLKETINSGGRAKSQGETRSSTKSSSCSKVEPSVLTDEEILSQVSVLNLDTGERIPLSDAEGCLPPALNPLSLHIMRLTNEYNSSKTGSEDEESEEDEESIVDVVVRKLPEVDPVVLKKKTSQLKKFLGKRVESAVTKAKTLAHKGKEEKDVFENDAPAQNTMQYVKIKTSHSHKGPPEFDNLMYVQELIGEHTGPIWCMKFSSCGRLLATAGQDHILRVWVLKQAFSYFLDIRTKWNADVKASPTPSQESLVSQHSSHSSEDIGTLDPCDDGVAPFMPKPFCVYPGHTADVLDVSWSKNYFMLTSSMDKTVRLWHISRKECLCIFKHVDFVTAIAFHPKDDRYFISGSLDGKLRLWSIPDKQVVMWNQVQGHPQLITAANFCQNGTFIVVGTYNGRCIFYKTEELKYFTQIHVKSSRGKNAQGRKITGIEPLAEKDMLLITSNDSRIRLYDLNVLNVACKYKGYSNFSSQIRAGFSHDGKFMVAGSENQCIYIWKTHHDYSKFSSARKDRNTYWEGVKAHSAVVTCAIFSPRPDHVFSFIEQQQQEALKRQKGKKGHDSATSTAAPNAHKSSVKDTASNTNKGYVLVSADFNGCIKVFLKKEKPKHSSLPASALA